MQVLEPEVLAMARKLVARQVEPRTRSHWPLSRAMRSTDKAHTAAARNHTQTGSSTQVLEPEVLSMARKLVARQVGPDAVPPASQSDKEEDEEPQFPSYQIKISTAAASPAAPAPSRRGSWREVSLPG